MFEKKLKIDVKRVIAVTLTYNRSYNSGITTSETKTYRSPEAAARQWAIASSEKYVRSVTHRIKIEKKLYRRSLPIFKRMFNN